MSPAVLIVDDEAELLDVTKISLEIAGYEVLTAGSAEEGLAILETSEVSVLLLDLRLPGMSGMDLLSHLRKSGRLDDLRVIVISAHASGHMEQEALGLGAVGYLVKPFKMDALTALVGEAV